MEICSYVTGFVDGEGSFLVSFSKRKKMRTGIEVRPAFTVSQHERSRGILEFLQRFFRCGTTRFNKSDRTWKYEVRSLDDLFERVIPHFERYPLQTSKHSDFECFRDICWMMRKGAHLETEGIHHIVDLAYGMNNVGARRFDKNRLLRDAREMKV